MESFSSPESVPAASVVEVLAGLLKSDPQKFRIFFRYLRDAFPNEACQVCVRYLGGGEGGAATVEHMLAWLKGIKYFGFLIDSQFLAIEEARRAAEVLRTEDSRFFLNFSRSTMDGTPSTEQRAVVARALALLDGLKDYSVLFSWLRGLTACGTSALARRRLKHSANFDLIPR